MDETLQHFRKEFFLDLPIDFMADYPGLTHMTHIIQLVQDDILVSPNTPSWRIHKSPEFFSPNRCQICLHNQTTQTTIKNKKCNSFKINKIKPFKVNRYPLKPMVNKNVHTACLMM